MVLSVRKVRTGIDAGFSRSARDYLEILATFRFYGEQFVQRTHLLLQVTVDTLVVVAAAMRCDKTNPLSSHGTLVLA